MDKRYRVIFLLVIFAIFSAVFVFVNHKIQLSNFWKNSTLIIKDNSTQVIFLEIETNSTQTVENLLNETNQPLVRSENETLTYPNDILILLFTGTIFLVSTYLNSIFFSFHF
jgi:hypothetical protein